jgi:GDPmannose 4,6-dehydratase
MSGKTVVITGANGQLGQYFIQYLQEKHPDLQIVGTIRHKSYDAQEVIFNPDKVKFELMDLSDPYSIENLILKYKPDYFINTAANAFVGDSWALPVQHIEYNCIGVLHQLEAIKKHSPHTRYFNMGTSEEFAISEESGPQNENTTIYPKSPYGCAKAAARYLVSVYRNSFNLYAIQGWTFNFESKLRGEKYVTRKITKGVARIAKAIKSGKKFEPIELGNIYSSRSWQHAADVVDGIWRMLNQDVSNGSKPKEYVLSSTDTHLVKEFVDSAFEQAGIENKVWVNTSIRNRPEDEELQTQLENGEWVTIVKINPKFYRPLDVTYLYGDPTKAKEELGWNPTFTYKDIIKEMIEYDLKNS